MVKQIGEPLANVPNTLQAGERYEIECTKKADDETLVITQPAEENEKPKQRMPPNHNASFAQLAIGEPFTPSGATRVAAPLDPPSPP